MLSSAYAAAADALRSADSIVITTHVNPDGDGIGAGLALQIALERLGKTVRFLCPSKVVGIYRFLPSFDRLRVVDTPELAAAEAPADVVISCDAGDRERIGAVWDVRRTTFIDLDHHATNTNFGDINVVDLDAASTGVAVSRLLTLLGATIDRPIAECLYTTIVFDTGRFMHSNTTAEVLRWSAGLLDTGIDAASINRRLTYTRTLEDLNLQRVALGQLAVDGEEPALAGITLDLATLASVPEPEDWGDLVEVPRSLRGNQVAYLLREKRGKDGSVVVRASLRSNPPFSIGQVALHYGGGGHNQAAGATIPGTIAEVLPDLLPRLRAAARG